MTTPRRAFLYCRVSDPSKADRVDPSASIPRQREELMRMAEEDGCLVVRVFEEGQTAHALGRPAYDEMMARLDEVDAVYVVAYDRLTRIPEPAEQERVRKAFVAAGVDIVTPGALWRYSDPEFDSPETRLHHRVQGLFAAHEWETITRRLKKGKLKHIELGEYYGHGVPYGYDVGFDAATGRKVFTINEDQAAVVREIFRTYAEGYGCARIAIALNARGIPSPKGAKWSQNTIRNSINQAVYTGLSKYKSLLVESKDFPPIIPREQWDATQALFARRATFNTPGPAGKIRPLSGILRCQGCDRPLIMVRNNHKYGAYYSCRGLRKDVECPGVVLYNAEEAHRIVLAWLKRQLRKMARPGEIEKLLRAQAQDSPHQPALADAARRRVAELARKFDGVLELAALKVIRPEEAAAKLDAIRDEQTKAKEHLESLEAQAKSSQSHAAFIAVVPDMLAALEGVGPNDPDLRKFFESTLERVYLVRTGKKGRVVQLAVERVVLTGGIEVSPAKTTRASG